MPGKIRQLAKEPTGIIGLDEITGGGLPKGRPTLVCGAAGCGKTLLAAEFIVRGIIEFNEPGVFMSFEETADDLSKNVASLGFDIPNLVRRKKLALDYVEIRRNDIEETGEYDLEGLFIRLGQAIDSVGARRVALDTIEALFAGLPNQSILRAELRRLFRWLKDKGVTAVITAEQGEGTLTRHGLEEYVSDCVIVLDHRVHEQISARRLRIIKYRGSFHGTNEYPFLIDEHGITVMPITSLRLQQPSSRSRVSTGLPDLDAMLGGKGFFRGSSVLISGTAGTGKSTLAATFANSVCQKGGRALYLSFEESPGQIMRNMGSIGLNLKSSVDKGLLRFQANRPTLGGLEAHLPLIYKTVESFKPEAVVVDPLSSFLFGDNRLEVEAMITRLVDYFKTRGITALFTNLTSGGGPLEQTFVSISSMIDTWILLRDIESSGERNRGMYILKSRGMPHSNQIREFRMTSQGFEVLDAYVGPGGALTGSARLAQEAHDRAEQALAEKGLEGHRLELEHKRKNLELQIAMLQAGFAIEEAEYKNVLEQSRAGEAQIKQERRAMAISRKANARRGGRNGRAK